MNACCSRLLSLCAMCLKFVVMLGIAVRISHPFVFADWECVWEYPTRHDPSLYTVSRKVPFQRSAKACQCFLLKHSFYGFQGAKLCWLAGEMTKYREGAREGRGEKRQRVQIFKCGVLAVQIIGPSAARPQRRSLMFPFKWGEKIFEPVYSAGNHKRSGALTRAMHM